MNMLIKVLADYLVIPVVLLGAYMILRLSRTHLQQAIVRGTLMALTALWFGKIASLFYQGVRPFEQLGIAPGASYLPNPGFPSDHALLVFAVVAVVFAATRHKKIGAVLFIGALLVSVGRILAHVHAPIDVIGSFVCVLLASVLWYGPKIRQQFRVINNS
jgi:undecaprenyl-diphosphatase